MKPGGSHVGVCKRIPAAALASSSVEYATGGGGGAAGVTCWPINVDKSTEELDHSCAMRCGSNATPAKFTTRK